MGISCVRCNQYNSPSHGYTERPLIPIKTSQIFELVSYDLVGPVIPESETGIKYALTIVEYFLKWVEVCALQNCNAPTIAQAVFDNWICRYGVMERLHNDSVNNVHGEIRKQFSVLLGVDQSKSSCLHPKGDGISETL